LNLPFFIARRYLVSKRKKNFINVISIVSVFAVALFTAAIIIVLSIFNGLGDLIHSLNDSFDPEIKIEATRGKSFPVDDQLLKKIRSVEGVRVVTEVIEDYVYARYNQANQVVTLKGVSNNFIEEKRIPAENIVEGDYKLTEKGVDYALIGYGIRSTLSIDVRDNFFPLQLYYVKNTKGGSLDPSQLYTKKNIAPGGVFSIVQNFDENYVIVPLTFAADLLNYGDKRTALEIITTPGSDPLVVENKLQELLGNSFNVRNSEEQHQDLYRVIRLEKLFASIAAVLLLIIGSINIYFNLMMLALDKKKDLSVLAAFGADSSFLKKIFILEGLIIALIGTVLGLGAGALIVLAQQQFGLVSMGMQSSIVEGYPVKMVATDFIYVFVTMSVITILISSRPAQIAARFASVQNL
jgi:lipoprotein-releasing system permease protein